jgi:hypothetical protein
MNYVKWLNAFLKERNFVGRWYQIENQDGTFAKVHSNSVIEYIKAATPKEQKAFQIILIRWDFLNIDIHLFFKDLAEVITRG